MARVPTAYVLDSFALLAYFGDEPGANTVGQPLVRAQHGTIKLFLSLVNLGEVYYITQRERGRDQAIETLVRINQLPLQQEPVDRELVLRAAALKADYAISYADAFAAGLAQRQQVPVVTGDPEFQKMTPVIEVVWLQQW
jgi:PIN domain nuclease of toxin-antitoxin system